MKVEIFEGYLKQGNHSKKPIKIQINEWLEDKDIEIVQTTQHNDKSKILISIFYEEKQ